jgi:hypothetical protein
VFKSLARHAVVAALVSSSLVVAPARAARATTSVDNSALSVDTTPCPPPSTGYRLDFWYGDPPRHLLTVELCHSIPPDGPIVSVTTIPCPYPQKGFVIGVHYLDTGYREYRLCFRDGG